MGLVQIQLHFHLYDQHVQLLGVHQLGVQEIKQYERYLGLPFLVGKKKKACLLYIKERVATKLHGWKE